MRILQHIISIVIIGLILSSTAYGQKKRTQIADQAFLDEHYYVAIDRYKKAYSKVKNNKAEKSRIAFNIAFSNSSLAFAYIFYSSVLFKNS